MQLNLCDCNTRVGNHLSTLLREPAFELCEKGGWPSRCSAPQPGQAAASRPGLPGRAWGWFALPEHFPIHAASHPQLGTSATPSEARVGQGRRQRCILSAGLLPGQPFAKIILLPVIYYNKSATAASLKSLLTNELPLKLSTSVHGGRKSLFF